MYVANDSIFNEVEQWKVEILVEVNRSGDSPLLSRNHSLNSWVLIQGREDFFYDEDPSELLQQAREDRKRYLVKKAEEKRLDDRMFARKKSCLSVAFSICCLALIAITPNVLLAEMDTSSRVGWVGLFLAVFQTASVFGQARSTVGRESAEREFVTRNFSELERRNV
ncbi:hypothetical protein [Corynebacterium minutissimum]|uniref:hypothetical protein n=1 Tax=Corynebacterium minutissimum TaxID=38301 RepID=UPI001EF236EA|nr:hypothetical protein [Corynebacterium minutissimum]MCG7230098.1 hypothetical protein [Corynebacterium minutissimum]MCG7237458.1 hypothetical protein [Corynebacterium minutissimum]